MKKILFTPGPLTTSETVKAVMMKDVGSRDAEFIEAVKQIRSRLLSLAHVSKEEGYEVVLMQGSGTFGIESVIGSVIGNDDVLLILANGAYGERIGKMADIYKMHPHVLRFPENEVVDPNKVRDFLATHKEVTHIACIHSETTTGLFNPIGEIGDIADAANCVFIVDAMSSFGGVQMNMKDLKIDFLISSSNKCIEGVPGFAFAICKKSELEKAKGQGRSLSLDLYEQWAGLEANGQFRFTPPTLSIIAFHRALQELESEGGVAAREHRYKQNKRILDEGMERLGFKQYLSAGIQGHIITSFLYPDDPHFDFETFYKKLSDGGFIIYPGKLGKVDAFRIGNIGQVFPEDVERLLVAIEEIIR